MLIVVYKGSIIFISRICCCPPLWQWWERQCQTQRESQSMRAVSIFAPNLNWSLTNTTFKEIKRPFWPYLILVTHITYGICGDKFVMWRQIRFLYVTNLKILYICHVTKCQISPHERCGEILNSPYLSCVWYGQNLRFSESFMWRNPKFLHMFHMLFVWFCEYNKFFVLYVIYGVLLHFTLLKVLKSVLFFFLQFCCGEKWQISGVLLASN